MIHTKTTAAALIVFLLLPQSLSAAGTLTVSDTVAGLPAILSVTGLIPGDDVRLSVTSPSDARITLSSEADGRGTLTTQIPASFVKQAGTYTARAQDASGEDATTSFRVLPGRPDMSASRIETDRDSLRADGADEAIVTVRIMDAARNGLPGRLIELISNRTGDRVTPLETETDADGAQRFSVRAGAGGRITLTAMDVLSTQTLNARLSIEASSDTDAVGGEDDSVGTQTAPRSAWTAQVSGNKYGPATKLQISLKDNIEDDLRAGIPLKMTVTAVDADGNRVWNFAETQSQTFDIYSPTDPNAILPAAYKLPKDPVTGIAEQRGQIVFTGKWQGELRIPAFLTFSKAGTHRIRVENAEKTLIGETTVTIQGQGSVPGDRKIAITSPKPSTKVSSTVITLKGNGPPLINVEVTGGSQRTVGEIKDDGTFEIPVSIDCTECVLQVMEDVPDGQRPRYLSDELRLTRDSQAPKMTLTVTPENPLQGMDVTATVRTEANLESVTLDLEGKTLRFSQADASGTYRLMFKAPDAGTYPLIVSAKDTAGNVTQLQATLKVTAPQVENVRVIPHATSADVLWDPFADPSITSYIIYVGTDPKNFTQALDTGRPETGVSVEGLKTKTEYFFAVTAKKGDIESLKSKIVSAKTSGLGLSAEALDGALKLRWENTSAETLSSFLLEFGTDPQHLDHKVPTLKAGTREYALKDLINGIAYTVRLTPVDVTGKVLTEAAETVTATPTGTTDFRPGTTDPIGFDVATSAPTPLHGSAPENTESGLPASFVWGTVLLSLALFAGLWQWHRRKFQRFLKVIDGQYHQ